ncbi:DNA mismatch repair protein MutS [Paenibacillus sp. NPDC058071]|uniref:endonuclease MutS2 n=1 Tax=Paenibacillus sp. NPDC058071 TaxID=3346326 RepID=UPI0036D8A353
MNERSMNRLEYGKMKEKLVSYAVSPAGKELAERLAPSVVRNQIAAWLTETEEASAMLATGASVPLSAMEGIDALLMLLGKGKIYAEQELELLLKWLVSVGQLKRYMDSKRQLTPTIAGYADSMYDLPQFRQELDRCIRFGAVTDQASANMAAIRRQIALMEDRIERKLEASLSKYKSALQEPIVSKRRGHSVIAVKRELRKQVPGTVWDESASGQTLFIEPIDVAGLQEELRQWKADEERERTVILSGLSDLADENAAQLRGNSEAMAVLDFIMAKGKLSRSYGGQKAVLTDEPVVRLIQARHPLLGNESEPLTVELGLRWKQLIITGPNTGGKTVALKTIGLLTLLVQSGLLPPAEEGSRFGIFTEVLADVGDGQSMEQSLSTFSSHLTILKEMLEKANDRSLLLLDEMAAGTDPGEGIALSIAVLEELLARRSLVAATTHFNEIKTFASTAPGCMNARMAFDPVTLKPLYRLEVGAAGESQAFAIASRIGLPEKVLERAKLLVQERTPAIPAESLLNPTRVPPHILDNAISDIEVVYETKVTEASVRSNPQQTKPAVSEFRQGDAVWIYPLRRHGIVFRPANERGEVIVQVKGEKLKFNRKRLKPYIAKEKLYPGEDYDMDIVFDTKGNRKIRKLMSRKHIEGLQIEMNPEE